MQFDGRVAIVTGAGGGLGRAYAIHLAQHGAKVVVNDLGGSREGAGASHKAADVVVGEIKQRGGEAIPNYDSVTEGERIVKAAIDAFGRIDIVINNAGILRDRSLAKMSLQDWDLVQQVHLHGAFAVTKAAWPFMLKQEYGRVIMTSSAAGLYGNYGQTNYGSAKLALYGFARCLAQEGEKKNVHCNIVAPMAGSRITETVLPPEVLALLDPAHVAPSVAYLCHEECTENGAVFEIGGGFVGRVVQQRAKGFSLSPQDGVNSKLLTRIQKLADFENPEYPNNIRQVDWVALAQSNSALLNSKPSAPQLSFKGQIAVVTGAGGGLGRAYALLLAKLGAHVVVNDMGKRDDGRMFADLVVEEVKRAGASASANYHNVLEGDAMAQEIIGKHGTIHILINNAGILRDKSFAKMIPKEWFDVLDVHLNGTFRVTKAFLPVFMKQKFGRILNTASAVGLYGNYGQANYSSAKAGIISFSKSLSQECSKHNILVNCIAPNAGTSMTATVLPKDIVELLKPDFVAPFAAALCHAESSVTGRVFEVGSGWISEVRWERSKWAPVNKDDLKAAFQNTVTHQGATYPQNATTSFIEIQQLAASLQPTGQSEKSVVVKVSPRDVILYNVGIGFGERDLKYVYEGASDFTVFPTFGVIPGFDGMMSISMNDYLNKFNPAMLLHGEHFMEFKEPIKPGERLKSSVDVVSVQDKGKGTTVTIRVTTSNENGDVKVVNEGTTFNRGATPKKVVNGRQSKSELSEDEQKVFKSKPEYSEKQSTTTSQALIYRLSGDFNPLHIDPALAKMAGFEKPILHGLCSFGIAAKHVVKSALNNDPERLQSIQGRFSKHVFPGDTLRTDIWKLSENRLAFIVTVEGRNVVAISHGIATIKAAGKKPTAAVAEKSAGKAAEIFKTLEKVFSNMPADQRADLMKKGKGIYRFDVKEGAALASFFINLKDGQGSIGAGTPATQDIIIEMNEDTLVQLLTGKLKGQSAFMKGLVKVKGNMMLATKLDVILSALGAHLKSKL